MSLKRCADSISSEPKRAKPDAQEGGHGSADRVVLRHDAKQTCSEQIPAILTLSDEMLLTIMKLLDPRDIVSLGCTCRRLDAVIRDRTLWSNVDFTAQHMMMCQIREFMDYLHHTTKSIITKGCVSLVDVPDRWQQQCSPLKMFRQLNKACPALESFIAIEHYYDARHVMITDFPPTLKRLVLHSCEVYFVPREKSYFHGINKHMTNLQELILDECQWLTPDSLMAISKCPKLRVLSLKGCRNVGTCYAYISLSSRFGFKALEVLDVRGSSLGDHEINCFQSIGTLTHLYLEVPKPKPPRFPTYYDPSDDDNSSNDFDYPDSSDTPDDDDDDEDDEDDDDADSTADLAPAADGVDPIADADGIDALAVADDSDPTAVVDDADPTTVADDTNPTAVADDTNPTAVTDDTDPTAVADDTDPVAAAPQEEPETQPPAPPPMPPPPQVRGPISASARCLCYINRTPEEDYERQQRTKLEIPMIQFATNSSRSSVEFHYEMTLLGEDEDNLVTPFVDADLVEQLDPDMLITDSGILSLGTRDVVVLDSGRRPLEATEHRNPKLTDLSILNCKAVTDLTLIHLVMLSSLKRLNVCGTSVTPRGIKQFRRRRPEVVVVSDFCGKEVKKKA